MKKNPKIVARGKWVLIKPVEKDALETRSGLLLPQTEERDQKSQGEVLSVGEEVKGIKVGQTVIYGTYAGENIAMKENTEKVEYKMLHDDDIIAFIE